MIRVHSAHMSTHHDLDQWNLNQDKRLCQRVCGKFGLVFTLKWHSWILKCFTINVEVKKIRPFGIDVLSFEAKNRVFEFHYQNMKMFGFVRCSKNRCLSLFAKQFSKSSECPIRFEVRCLMVRSQKYGCSSSISNRWTHSSSFDVREMMFKFVKCSIKWCSTHHYRVTKTIFCRKKCLYLFQFWSYTKILDYGKVWELYILFKLIKIYSEKWQIWLKE